MKNFIPLIAVLTFGGLNLTYAGNLSSFVERAGNFLSGFSSSQQSCNPSLEHSFDKPCPDFIQKNIKEDLKNGSRFSKLTRIDSPYKVCDENVKVKLNNADSPAKINQLFSKQFSNLAGVESPFATNSCFSEIDKLDVDSSLKNRIKNNVAAEYNINLDRIQNGTRNYLSEIANINSILNVGSSNYNCSKITAQQAVRSHCEALKKCSPEGGFSTLTADAEKSLKDLQSLKDKYKNSSRADKARLGNKIKEVEKLIYAANPLLKGDKFKKAIKSGGLSSSNISKALKAQLLANKSGLIDKIKKNENALSCINGSSDEGCKDLNKLISSNPEVQPLAINTKARGANARKEKDKVALNHFTNKIQCFSEIRNLKKTQSKEIRDFGLNAALTIATGGIGALAGGPRLGALYTRASALGAKAPKLTKAANFFKTPKGKASAGIWGADGAFVAYEFSGAAKACDEKIGKIQEVTKPKNRNSCPAKLDTPAYNLQSDYKSCYIEVGLASLGLLPVAPAFVSSLIRGRSLRTLLTQGRYTKEQVEIIAKLQNKVGSLNLYQVTQQIDKLPKEQAASIIKSLERFDGGPNKFKDVFGRAIGRLVNTDKLPREKGAAILAQLKVNKDYIAPKSSGFYGSVRGADGKISEAAVKDKIVKIVLEDGTEVSGKAQKVQDVAGEPHIFIEFGSRSKLVKTSKIKTINVTGEAKKVTTARKNTVTETIKAKSKNLFAKLKKSQKAPRVRGRVQAPKKTTLRERRANLAENKKLGFIDSKGNLKPKALENYYVEIQSKSGGRGAYGVFIREDVIDGKKYVELDVGDGKRQSVPVNNIGLLKVKSFESTGKDISSSVIDKNGKVNLLETYGKYIEVDTPQGKIKGRVQNYSETPNGGQIIVSDDGVRRVVNEKDIGKFKLNDLKLKDVKIETPKPSVKAKPKTTARQRAGASIKRGRLALYNKFAKIPENSLNGKSVEFKTKTGDKVTGEVLSEKKLSDGSRVITLRQANGARYDVRVKDISGVNELAVPVAKPGTTRLLTDVTENREAQTLFTDIKGAQFGTEDAVSNSRDVILPNGSQGNVGVISLARTKGAIKKFDSKVAKPLDKGHYTYAILEDGSLVVGKVEDTLEYGVKHVNIADGKRVKVAGELKTDGSGNYDFNLLSGTYTRKIARDEFGGDDSVLAERAEQALEQYLGVGKKTDRELFNDLPKADLREYCKKQLFRAFNEGICE